MLQFDRGQYAKLKCQLEWYWSFVADRKGKSSTLIYLSKRGKSLTACGGKHAKDEYVCTEAKMLLDISAQSSLVYRVWFTQYRQ